MCKRVVKRSRRSTAVGGISLAPPGLATPAAASVSTGEPSVDREKQPRMKPFKYRPPPTLVLVFYLLAITCLFSTYLFLSNSITPSASSLGVMLQLVALTVPTMPLFMMPASVPLMSTPALMATLPRISKPGLLSPPPAPRFCKPGLLSPPPPRVSTPALLSTPALWSYSSTCMPLSTPRISPPSLSFLSPSWSSRHTLPSSVFSRPSRRPSLSSRRTSRSSSVPSQPSVAPSKPSIVPSRPSSMAALPSSALSLPKPSSKKSLSSRRTATSRSSSKSSVPSRKTKKSRTSAKTTWSSRTTATSPSSTTSSPSRKTSTSQTYSTTSSPSRKTSTSQPYSTTSSPSRKTSTSQSSSTTSSPSRKTSTSQPYSTTSSPSRKTSTSQTHSTTSSPPRTTATSRPSSTTTQSSTTTSLPPSTTTTPTTQLPHTTTVTPFRTLFITRITSPTQSASSTRPSEPFVRTFSTRTMTIHQPTSSSLDDDYPFVITMPSGLLAQLSRSRFAYACQASQSRSVVDATGSGLLPNPYETTVTTSPRGAEALPPPTPMMMSDALSALQSPRCVHDGAPVKSHCLLCALWVCKTCSRMQNMGMWRAHLLSYFERMKFRTTTVTFTRQMLTTNLFRPTLRGTFPDTPTAKSSHLPSTFVDPRVGVTLRMLRRDFPLVSTSSSTETQVVTPRLGGTYIETPTRMDATTTTITMETE